MLVTFKERLYNAKQKLNQIVKDYEYLKKEYISWIQTLTPSSASSSYSNVVLLEWKSFIATQILAEMRKLEEQNVEYLEIKMQALMGEMIKEIKHSATQYAWQGLQGNLMDMINGAVKQKAYGEMVTVLQSFNF